MRKSIDDITEDTFEILEFVDDVVVYAGFSGYHSPIAATLDFLTGGDPVMIAVHVLKYNENLEFSYRNQQNKFTEADGLLHRKFYTARQVVSSNPLDHRSGSKAYADIQSLIWDIRAGYESYSIAPVISGRLENMI